MKQLLLATTLIAIPVAGFAAVEVWVLPPAATAADPAASLGDLSAYGKIVTETQRLVDTGDLAAAGRRITLFETMWDDDESTLRPKAPAAWGNIDAAADRTFAALRASHPDAASATKALTALSATLADPTGGGTSGGLERVAGVAVTDANGHPIPCEAMLKDLRAALADGSIPQKDQARATDLQGKATERCNADDDTRADAFSAEALALATH